MAPRAEARASRSTDADELAYDDLIESGGSVVPYGIGWLRPDWYPLAAVPLDQGVADRGALSTSLRSFSMELAVPSGFRQVYGLPGKGPGEARYYRADGAVYAVFPESAYRRQRGRETALVPAGTVFHIGSPESSPAGIAASSAGRQASDRSLLFDDRRVAARVAGQLHDPMHEQLNPELNDELIARDLPPRSAATESSADARLALMRADARRRVARSARSGDPDASDERDERDGPIDGVTSDAAREMLPSFIRDEAYRRDRLRGVPRA